MKRQVGKPGKQRLEPTEFGNFFPICSGRILFNRSKDSQSYIAIVITLLPLILVCFNYFKLIRNTSPWLLFICTITYILCVSFLLLTWLTEPGVCERRNEEEEPAMEITEEQRKVASLMACVRNYKMQLIMRVFDQEPSFLNKTNIEGRTVLFSAVLLNKPFVVLPLLSHPGSFPDPQFPPQPPHPRYLQSHRHALRSFPQRTCVLPFSSRTTASSTSSWSIWASLPSTSPYDSLSPPPQTEKARYISEVYSTLPTYDVFTDSYFLARRSHRHYLSSLATYDYLLPHASLPVVSPSLEPIPLVDSNLFPASFFRSSLLPRPPAKPQEELDHTPLLNPPKSAKAGPMAVSGTQVVPMEIESTQDLARSDSSPNSDVELSYTDSLDEKSSMSSQSLVLLADSPEESFVSVPSRSFHQAIEAGDASGVKRSSFICIDANVIVTVRRCRICHIFMPPRSFHCRMCDCCVRGFDHHCPWVGNCIGIRNHFYFVGFMFSAVLVLFLGLVVASWGIVVSLARCLEKFYGFNAAFVLKDAWPDLVFFVGATCLIAPLGNLLCYHLFLVSKNATTHEEIRLPDRTARRKSSPPSQSYFPYDRGLMKNWFFFINTVNVTSHYH
ncbi:hypothetical protein WA538_005025, partial [Blastocystis sp. DL]